MANDVNSGPIPGENFTSDTKNYPWHQPPEFTNLNQALDMMAKRLTDFKRANGILSMIEIGVPVTRVADMILTSGIGEGKWTPDFALLLAGPVTRMIELICIGFEVEYTLGIEEDPDDFETSSFFKEEKKLQESANGFEILKQELPAIKTAAAAEGEAPEGGKEKDLQSSGFMSMKAPKEQAAEQKVAE